MSEIWKFPLAAMGEQLVSMPENAEILTAAAQDDAVTVWARVEPENKPARRLLQIFPTGYNADAAKVYVGTCHLNDGRIVLHVFDGGEK